MKPRRVEVDVDHLVLEGVTPERRVDIVSAIAQHLHSVDWMAATDARSIRSLQESASGAASGVGTIGEAVARAIKGAIAQ